MSLKSRRDPARSTTPVRSGAFHSEARHRVAADGQAAIRAALGRGLEAAGSTRVSSSTDASEARADALADELVRSTGAPPAHSETGRGGQAPVPDARSFFQDRLGVDLGDVRVHAGAEAAASARQVRAKAYAIGSHVVLGSEVHGEERANLLAHELAHVAQDRSAPAPTAVLHRKESETGTYVVQPGDTIASIARKLGVTVDALRQANVAKIRTWRTARGDVQGFDAGDELVVPGGASKAGVASAVAAGARAAYEYVATGVAAAWSAAKAPFTSKTEPKPKAEPEPAAPKPSAGNPKEVVEAHSRLGTFGKHGARVTSTTRDPQKQLEILRGYCDANRAALDAFAASKDGLRGTLDWKAFASCGLSDQDVWLPFFFALLDGGRGADKNSRNRTLPLVGSPVQAVWKDRAGNTRNANASPHLKGEAMDVADGDLDHLAKTIERDVPEFRKDGPFPVASTQIENVQGQALVHVNFARAVFAVGGGKSDDKAPI